MALILTTSTPKNLSPQQSHYLYNDLDCCVTAEVHDNLLPRLNANALRIYRFEMAMQGPSLTMQLRGIRIDERVRQQNLELLRAESKTLSADMDAEAVELQGHGFKWGKAYAPPTGQLAKLFYEHMKIHVYRNRKTGKPTVDKSTLKRIAKQYSKARKIAQGTLNLRDWGKQLEIFEKGVSDDGRFRATWSVGQTETGRWASSKDPYGYGDNLQNKDKRIRNMFIPDPGMVMVNVDLAQSDSRCIAYISEDENYIRAHEKGNVHVEAAYIFWPEEKWSNDPEESKHIAKTTPADWIPQPRVKKGEEPKVSLYKISKNNQHAINFGTKAPGLATRIGSSREQAEDYMEKYFGKYPRILDWQQSVRNSLKTTGTITTALGRTRQFFGRPWDDATVREGLAYEPQSLTSDILCVGLWRIWDELDPHSAQVLANGHDAVLMQVPIEKLDFVKLRVVELMRVEVPIKGRTMMIPCELETGSNWRDMI